MSLHTLDPGDLTDAERRRLRQLAEAPEITLGRTGEASARAPEAVEAALRVVADLLARGRTVSIGAEDEALTTTEAARLLNVSRPHIVKLLEAGHLPFHKVGTHRRVYRRDVLAYQARQRRNAEEAMQALADQAQDLGLGYDTTPRASDDA